MTRDQFLEKVEEIIPDITELIREKAKIMLTSGSIELEDYEDNYILPKLFIVAIGKEIIDQYRHPNITRQDVITINNMFNMM